MGKSSNLTSVPTLPIGGIIMWSGGASNFDSTGKGTGSMVGWALCNGNNNTPDLQDIFIVGAGNLYAAGSSGGEAQVTLTVDQIPPHTHQSPSHDGGNTYHNGLSVYATDRPQSGDHPFTSGTTGGGLPHTNLPPYYALYYMMRIL